MEQSSKSKSGRKRRVSKRTVSGGSTRANAARSTSQKIDVDTRARSLPISLHGELFDTSSFDADPSQALSAYQEELGWILDRRGVDSSRYVETPPKVFFQALQSVATATARNEALFLLATCLDETVAHRVLPSHVEITRQLSEDEFTLLREISSSHRGTPVGDAMLVIPRAQPILHYKYVVLEATAQPVFHKVNIPQYIDNLSRLRLISVHEEPAASEATYLEMSRYKFLKEVKADVPKRSKIAIHPLSVHLTELGRGLLAICSL